MLAIAGVSPAVAAVVVEDPEYIRLAQLTAEAQGKQFIIGVRPYDKGWYAHCDGVEWDGAGPEDAVYSVIRTLAANAKKASTKANADAKSLEQQAIDLADTLALIKNDREELEDE